MGRPVAAKVAIGCFFLIKRIVDAGMAGRVQDRSRFCPPPECPLRKAETAKFSHGIVTHSR